MELLRKSLENSTVITKGDYNYIINPLTDGIPEIKPDLFKEVVDALFSRIKQVGPVDKIVTIEAMGIPYATALSLLLKKPFTIIRKRQYNLDEECIAYQKTGYSENKLFINGLKKGENIIIIDDLVSTGGTLKAVIKQIKNVNAVIKGIFIVINKGEQIKKIENEFDINIQVLADIKIKNKEIQITHI